MIQSEDATTRTQGHYRSSHRQSSSHRLRRVAGLARAGARLVGWGFLVSSLAVLAALGIGPRFGRYRTLTVLSGSMTPGIPIGAMIVDTPERPDQLRVGQVISYEIPVEDHRVESHRVVEILKGGDHPIFKTKGDANTSPDPWTAVVTSPTIWRLRAVVPHAGWMILDLRTPLFHKTLVWGVPALLGLLWLIDIWRKPEAVNPDPETDEPLPA